MSHLALETLSVSSKVAASVVLKKLLCYIMRKIFAGKMSWFIPKGKYCRVLLTLLHSNGSTRNFEYSRINPFFMLFT